MGAAYVHIGGDDVVISNSQRGSGIGRSGLVSALVSDGNSSTENRNPVHRKCDRSSKRTGSCAGGDGGGEGNGGAEGGWIEVGGDDYGCGVDWRGIAYQNNVERLVDGGTVDIDIGELHSAGRNWHGNRRRELGADDALLVYGERRADGAGGLGGIHSSVLIGGDGGRRPGLISVVLHRLGLRSRHLTLADRRHREVEHGGVALHLLDKLVEVVGKVKIAPAVEIEPEGAIDVYGDWVSDREEVLA